MKKHFLSNIELISYVLKHRLYDKIRQAEEPVADRVFLNILGVKEISHTLCFLTMTVTSSLNGV